MPPKEKKNQPITPKKLQDHPYNVIPAEQKDKGKEKEKEPENIEMDDGGASGSSVVATQAPSITDIKEWSTEELIQHLQAKFPNKLIEEDFKLLKKNRIEGIAFLEQTKQDFMAVGMKLGPASIIAGYVNELNATGPSRPIGFKYTPRLGGIGGTTRLSTEGDGQNTYEGIDLNSSDICRREVTVKRMADKLWAARVLLVRSPPMAGKTSLAQLLEQYLLNNGTLRIIRISLLWMNSDNGTWTFTEEFKRLMGGTSWKDFVDQCNTIGTILIIDEVQILYKSNNDINASPHHGGSAFWSVFKSCQQSGNLRIVIFAVYGYRGAWDHSSVGAMDVSPFDIQPGNTWGLEDVRFTRDEYDDYVSRFCNTHFGNMKNDDARALQDYVCNTTGRHPGLVSYFMNNIRQKFQQRLKYGGTLKFSEIFMYLKSYSFTNMASAIRAYTDLEHLSDIEKLLCDKVFRDPPNIILSSCRVEVKRLIKTNLLTEQSGILDFASPFLRTLYLQQRWGCTTRPMIPPKDFKSFLSATFVAMSAKTLQNSYGIGKDGRLLERTWQMEFYRAATQVLPNDVFISPDVGARFGSHGFLDFYVDDGRNWAIELLRDGDKAPEHQKRFEPGGVYNAIKEASNEWAIIDIRSPEFESLPRMKDDHWIYVRCQEGFESVTIAFKDEEPITIQLTGS